MSTSSWEIEQLRLFDSLDEASASSPQLYNPTDLTEAGIPHREIGRFHRFRVFLVDSTMYTGNDWLYTIRPENEILTNHDLMHWSALVRVALHYRRFGEPTTILERFAEKRHMILMDAANAILGPVDLVRPDDSPMCRQLYYCIRGVFFNYLHQNDDAGYNWVGYDVITRF